MRSRTRTLTLIAAGVVAASFLGGAAAVAAPLIDNGWPYAHAVKADNAKTYTLAAVGDIACEPDDADNANNPAALKCGSPSLGDREAGARHEAGRDRAPRRRAVPGRQVQRLRGVVRAGVGRAEVPGAPRDPRPQRP